MCDVCGLRSQSLRSNSVLYISIINNASLQELVMQGLEERLEKSSFQCKRNTWHLCSKQFLQPPKYLVISVNRFSYVGGQFMKKNRSLVPLDSNFMLCSYEFSLQATIDHHGLSVYRGHCTASVYCCEKTFYCNDKITICDINNTLESSTTHVVVCNLNTEDGKYLLPWRRHILSISLNTGRVTGAKTCWVDNVFPPDGLWFSYDD